MSSYPGANPRNPGLIAAWEIPVKPIRAGIVSVLLLIPGNDVWAAEQDSPPAYQAPIVSRPIDSLDLAMLRRRLIDVLLEMHVEKDSSDPQLGMVYETYDPQRKIWVEAEGRDTMHHLMWTMVGLANAYRAGGDRATLEFLQEYPLAFYLRMMQNGEQYFGAEFGNGFCPYYWDDGDAFDLGAYLRGEPLGPEKRINGFSPMSSIHLAQDLSVGHLDMWWLLHDPRIQSAAADLYQQVHFGKTAERFAARNYALIQLKLRPADDLARFRAGEAEGKARLRQLPEAERQALYAKQFPPTYGPIVTAAHKTLNEVDRLPSLAPARREPTDTIADLRLRRCKAGSVPAFPDDLAFDYYLELCRNSAEPSIRDEFARHFTMELLTRTLLNEYWLDDAPYPLGYAHFPGFNAAWTMQDGRFVSYHSQAPRHYWHTRGIHYAWLSAIALQMMEVRPDMHEQYQRQAAADAAVIRFADRSPLLDGQREPQYADAGQTNGASLALASDPRSLFVFLEHAASTPIHLAIIDGAESGEPCAAIRVNAAGHVSVVNGQGAALRHWSRRDGQKIEIQIPYQIDRLQGQWMTAVEHGRGRVVLRGEGAEPGETSRAIYFLSDPQRIKNRLRTFVEGTIVNHAEILERQGWLPYAIADKSSDPFTRLSFSGAYGHLLHTIAQYQLWQQGRRDWIAKQEVRVVPP